MKFIIANMFTVGRFELNWFCLFLHGICSGAYSLTALGAKERKREKQRERERSRERGGEATIQDKDERELNEAWRRVQTGRDGLTQGRHCRWCKFFQHQR